MTLEESGKSPGRINRALAAIRWWARQKMKSVAEAEHMPPATMVQTLTDALAITLIPDRVKPYSAPGPGLTAEGFSHLIATCQGDPSPAGARDGALFSLARFLGLKPGVLRRLRREALIESDGNGHRLYAAGPRGQVQDYNLSLPVDAACRAWLSHRDNDLAIQQQGRPLFLAINKGGRILNKGLSGEALRQVLKKRQRQAGLNGITWHILSRSQFNHA